MKKILLLFLIYFSICPFCLGEESKIIKIGFIGSLSGFAASYGNAVLQGAQLALEELNKKNKSYEFFVEDDESSNSKTINSYKFLQQKNVKVIIAGTWWINGIVKISEQDKIPILSCETLLNKDTVFANNYFILGGDLSDWVKAFSEIIQKNNYKTASVIHFTSGFGETIKEEMISLFKRNGRDFLGSIEYQDPSNFDANTLLLKLKKLSPDVVYLDAQPNGLAIMLKKMRELHLNNTTVLTNAIAQDVLNQKLLDIKQFPHLFYTKRESYTKIFRNKFFSKYKIEPYLNSDLGYYAVYLINSAINKHGNLQNSSLNNIQIDGINFQFDNQNVFRGIKQEVFEIP